MSEGGGGGWMGKEGCGFGYVGVRVGTLVREWRQSWCDVVFLVCGGWVRVDKGERVCYFGWKPMEELGRLGN
jgi:hypothetical protein